MNELGILLETTLLKNKSIKNLNSYSLYMFCVTETTPMYAHISHLRDARS